MKKLFTLLALLMVTAGWAFAASTNYLCADFNGLSTKNADFTVTFGPYSMALAKTDKGATAPVYNANAKDLRVYANGTLTLSTTGETFNKVVFNVSTKGKEQLADVLASVGSVTVDPTTATATWTGTGVKSVTFTVGAKNVYGTKTDKTAGQLCFSSIDITTGSGQAEETVSKPVFSVAGGTYHCVQDVAINCGTTGASIYYTLNGSTPTASSTAYTEPLHINAQSTTVKAIAIKGDKQSEVAEATYVIESAVLVNNIAEYQNVADSTYIQFKNDVNVLAHNGKNLYVKDATGYGFFYGDMLGGKTYKNGDVIPSGFVGQKITFNGMPELSCYPTDGFGAAKGNSPIEPEVITTAGITTANFGHYVLIKNAKISYNNKTITDAAGTAQVRTGMGGYGNSTDETKAFDVIAIIGTTKDGDNFIPVALPVKLQEVGGGDVVDGIDIADFGSQADNAKVQFKNPATVLAVSGSRMFVKDETGYMLIYGNTGQTYSQGNVIPAGFGGTKTTYDGEPELKTPFTGFKAASSTVLVTPETLTANMVNHNNFGHFVVAKNVTISEVGTGTTVTGKITLSTGETIDFCNNMGANMPSDLTKKYDIYGVIGSYGKTNTIYQLLTTRITEAGGGDVEVADVNSIEDLYNLGKGVNGRITSDMVAIYQNGQYLYVKNNNTYALVYGNVTNKFENGDVITNAIANWTLYQNAKQLVPVDSTFASTRKVAAIEPTEITVEEIGTDMVHNYLLIKDAQFEAAEAANTYTLFDDTAEAVMFNKFTSTVTIPEDFEGKKYDVKCFVTLFNDAVELYPVEIKDNSAIKGDVNLDGKIDVTDLNIIINIMLGSDKKDYDGRADLNGDGKVDVVDMNQEINLILGK
ncbi:MAG: chitobiase/beta-hexosaminidase C-terminal domain-containing protein [Bacteroidales bacterium]|nr:chitobiase/beta-hexosaminidase C-terminal domain-containing protein [Candidatus Sodaliphilus aphodohippi]